MDITMLFASHRGKLWRWLEAAAEPPDCRLAPDGVGHLAKAPRACASASSISRSPACSLMAALVDWGANFDAFER